MTASAKYTYFPTETPTYQSHHYSASFVSSVAQESKLNPRLIAKSKAEFIDIITSPNLPDPKQMHIVVPTNKRCGQTIS